MPGTQQVGTHDRASGAAIARVGDHLRPQQRGPDRRDTCAHATRVPALFSAAVTTEPTRHAHPRSIPVRPSTAPTAGCRSTRPAATRRTAAATSTGRESAPWRDGSGCCRPSTTRPTSSTPPSTYTCWSKASAQPRGTPKGDREGVSRRGPRTSGWFLPSGGQRDQERCPGRAGRTRRVRARRSARRGCGPAGGWREGAAVPRAAAEVG